MSDLEPSFSTTTGEPFSSSSSILRSPSVPRGVAESAIKEVEGPPIVFEGDEDSFSINKNQQQSDSDGIIAVTHGVHGLRVAKDALNTREKSASFHDLILSISESSYGKEKEAKDGGHSISDYVEDKEGAVLLHHEGKEGGDVELDKRVLLAKIDTSHSRIFSNRTRLEMNNSVYECLINFIILLQLHGAMFYSGRLNAVGDKILSVLRSLCALLFDFRALSSSLYWNPSNNQTGQEDKSSLILLQSIVVWVLSAMSSIYIIIVSVSKRGVGRIVGFEATPMTAMITLDKLTRFFQRITFIPLMYYIGKSFDEVHGAKETDRCFVNYSGVIPCGSNASFLFTIVNAIIAALFLASRICTVVNTHMYCRSVSYVGRFNKIMKNAEILLGCGLSLEYRSGGCSFEASNRYSPFLGLVLDIVLSVVAGLSGFGSEDNSVFISILILDAILVVVSVTFPFRTIQLCLTNVILSIAQIPFMTIMVVRNTTRLNGYTSSEGVYIITMIFFIIEAIIFIASYVLVFVPKTAWPTPRSVYNKFGNNKAKLENILRSIKKCEYRLLKISIEPLVFTPLQEIKEILAIIEDADNIFEAARCDILQRQTKQLLSRVRDVETRKLKENKAGVEDNINTREVYTKIHGQVERFDSKYALLPEITRKMLMNAFVITHILDTARTIRAEKWKEQKASVRNIEQDEASDNLDNDAATPISGQEQEGAPGILDGLDDLHGGFEDDHSGLDIGATPSTGTVDVEVNE